MAGRVQTGARRRVLLRIAGAGAALLPLLGVAACEPDDPESAQSTTTTTAPAGTSTTTTSTSTTTTSSSTSTSTTTSTTTPPDPETGAGFTLQDTGLTRVRLSLSSEAAWLEVNLVGTRIDMSRVVSTTGTFGISSIDTQQIAGSGQGTAVIDLLLTIPPGANTSLRMCKNHRGPASATVTRRTVGEAVVGSLYNDGTSILVPADGCENARSATMTRADLIGPVRWPARRDPRPLVLAMYYPWYDAAALAEPFPDQPTGPANTADPAQVLAAMDLARASNVDGYVVEYEATPANDAMIDTAYAAADARPGFHMALLLDFALLANRGLDGLGPQGLDRALSEVASRASRASQLEVGGDPVVFLFSSKQVDPVTWSAAVGRLETRTGLTPFFIDQGDTGLGAPGRYDYGELSSGDQLAAWTQDRLTRLRKEPSFNGSEGPLWVAPVMPGYDDRSLGRPNPMYVSRNGGLRYEQAWNAALGTLPDWILISTWNEYYEQTHVMPGSSTGYQALDQTRNRAAAFHTTG